MRHRPIRPKSTNDQPCPFGVDRRSIGTMIVASVAGLAAPIGRTSGAEAFGSLPVLLSQGPTGLRSSAAPIFGLYRDETWLGVEGAENSVLNMAVQAVDGPLPAWARPCSALERTPDIEIVLVRGTSPISNIGGVEGSRRFLFCDASLGDITLPDCALRIEAAAEDLDTAAEALVRLINGRLLIGADLSDVLSIARTGAGRWDPGAAATWETCARASMGRASVIEGVGAGRGPVALAVRDRINALENAAFSGGVFVMDGLAP